MFEASGVAQWSRFAPEVAALEVGGGVALWHRRTGRHAVLSAETLDEIVRWTPGLAPPPALGAVAARLDRLHLLRESDPPDVAALIPARSRLALLFPATPALWLPSPTARTPGGFAYAERRLDGEEVALWRAFNGARTAAAAARVAGVSVARALAFLAELTHPAVQAIQLRERPVTRRDLSLERLVAPDRPRAARPSHLSGAAGETTLEHYHLHEITDGDTHFDDVETTVAHAFAVPHPALGGQRYGERLFEVMEARGLLPLGDGVTLEIGPGDGELGEAWLDRAAQSGRLRGEHIRLDQSPALLATQRRRQPGTRELLGSATAIPLPDTSVDVVVCNEVIADLSAVPYDPRDPVSEGPTAEVARRVERYGLKPLPCRALYNLGAWQLIEELARVLRPGGAAFVSEFGGLDEQPEETVQLDHPEVSIHFGMLAEVARALGMDAAVVPLPELLGLDLGATSLARHSYEAVRARARAEGRTIRARAWTPETLELPWPVEGLHWLTLADPGPGPLPTRFYALVLRR